MKMVSGIGRYHTNNVDAKHSKKLLTIDMVGIRALVDQPQQVDKSQAQWVISSSLASRLSEAQKFGGEYHFIWADLDEKPPSLHDLADHLTSIVLGADYELFNTASATVENQKARIIIPMAKPLNFDDWHMAQQQLNAELLALNITPDYSNEKANQVCYLPNRGVFYGSRSRRDGTLFDPMQTWAAEISAKRGKLEAERIALETAKTAAIERRAVLTLSGAPNLMTAFNQAYTPQDWMTTAGYDQRGETFRHPNSETGNYSASVRADSNGVLRVNTLSSADPLYVAGGGAHDAFSVFTVLMHSGNRDAALKDAGDNLLTIGSVSYNRAVQREHMQKQSAAAQPVAKNDDQIDYSTMPEGQQGDSKGTKPPAPAFKLVSANDLMTRSISHDWQIKGLFEHGNIGQIFGPTGSGKSFVVLDMGYCIATGLDYCGKPTKQGNVVYICGEGFGGLTRRLQALQSRYKADITDKLFISEQPGAFMSIDVTAAVAEAIAAVGNVSLVVIDTYHRNMGGGAENSADDFGTVLRNIDAFLKPFGVTVLLIHHSGHEATDRSRGSSAIRAAMDFEYKTTLTSNKLTLTNTKMKDAGTPPPMAFDFVQVELGVDHDGEAITSAYLEYKEGGTENSGGKVHRKLSARDEAILTSLDRAIADHGIEPDADIKTQFGGFDSLFHPDRKVAHVDHWRELAYKTITIDGDGDKSDALKKAFKRTREKLADTRAIVVHGDYAWRLYEEVPNQGDRGQLGDN
jgi:hypothetical protein